MPTETHFAFTFLGIVVLLTAIFVALVVADHVVARRVLRDREQAEATRVAEQILRAAGWPEDLIRPWAKPATHEDEHGETRTLESWGHSKRRPRTHPLTLRPDTSGFVKVVELEPEVTPKALPCPHGSRRWVQFEKDPNGGLRHAYRCRRSACPPIWVASTPSIEKETKQ